MFLTEELVKEVGDEELGKAGNVEEWHTTTVQEAHESKGKNLFVTLNMSWNRSTLPDCI